MINALEGIPGSGKSYEAVVMHVLPSLQQGRLVITNLPLLVEAFAAIDPAFASLIQLRMKSQPVLGIWDAEGVDDKGHGSAYKLADVRNSAATSNVPVFGSVWDYYSDWKHPKTGNGPLYIIDEAHLALPATNTNQEVIEWYKLHRHFNADVLLATQSFRDINQPIARLIAMLIRCRKADILGKKDSYIRKVHAGYRGAVISQEERKYEPQFFCLYRSHTQGNSVIESAAGDVVPLSLKLRRFTRWFWAFTILVCAGVAWWLTTDRKHKPKPPVPIRAAQTVPSARVGTPQTSPANMPGVKSSDAPPPEAVAVEDLEPLKGKTVHLTGWMRTARGAVYTFAVASGASRQFNVTLADLQASGYTFRALGDCMGYLTWEKRVRTVTCDAPALANGTADKPVVMDFKSGQRSDSPPAL